VIHRIHKLSVAILFACFCSAGIPGTAEAASFVAQTKGNNNNNKNNDALNFYSFAIEDEGDTSDVFIKSIQIDLAAGGDNDAYFDYSGLAPLLNLGSLQGLTDSDITFTPLAGTPVLAPSFNPEDGDSSVLQISFAAGSFGIGDSFQFGAETDYLTDDVRDDGDDFARAGVAITLELEDGSVETVSFSEVQNNHSRAVQSIIYAAEPPEPVAEVPEPLSVLGLFTVGTLGRLTLKRSQSR
jgi:hypothetical protein